MLLGLTLGAYAQYSASVYTPLEKNYRRFKTPLGSMLLLNSYLFIKFPTNNSFHFQKESIPLSCQEGGETQPLLTSVVHIF